MRTAETEPSERTAATADGDDGSAARPEPGRKLTVPAT
jgi:hypothetical protein